MFKLDLFKLITTSVALVLSSTLLYGGSDTNALPGKYISKMGAVDGGVIYPRKDGTYTAYRYNEQSTKGVNFGRVPTANELKAWDVDIMPDGTGLPDGEGSVSEGDELYEKQCSSCHGEFGAGGKGYPTLTGGNQEKLPNGVIKTLTNQRIEPGMEAPKRTIGTYWPKATTLIWYIRDAMPYAHPKSLTNNDIYAITAYLLKQDNILIDGQEMDDDSVLNREKLMKIKMPNENGFYPNIDGPNGVENVRKFFSDRAKNIGAGTRCMKDCKDLSSKGNEPTVMKIDNEITDVVPPYSMARDLPPEVENKLESKAEKMYNDSCKLCHGSDKMGAPVVGDVEAWNKVTQKGFDNVVHNAIDGVGGMPPKGGYENFTNSEVQMIVEFMIDSSKKKH
ncbi:MAG: c-type cytochrome [Campylobacterales bacterium]|nr:c-type cytochrome [Campylobacterales bacterium]